MRYKYIALFWDSARDSTSDSTPIPTVTLTVFPASPVPTLNQPRECVSVTLLHVTYLLQNSVLSQKSATRDEQKIKINSKEYLHANLKSSFHLI